MSLSGRSNFPALACALAIAAGVLAACETTPSREAIGTGVGAVIGGVLGSRFGSGAGRTAATIGGVVIGGAIGNVIGRRMDEEDRRRMSEALSHNSAGQSSSWNNASTAASYTVTPGQTYVRDGLQCRNFTQEAIIDGQPRTINGTACRRAEGADWEAS